MTVPEKIRADGVHKVFRTRRGRIVALKDVNFSLAEGRFLAVVGPSGCGKTTLLRILAGLERCSAGRVHIRHDDPAKPATAMVFQEQSVLPWMTVRENIGYGLRLRRAAPDHIRRVVDYYLEVIGLADFADAYPYQLSGGMKQRVSVARAFAVDPEVLLMDEPFAALDEQNKMLLQEQLLKIWEGTGKTVVYITHSIDEALYLSDQVLIMTAGPGTVKEVIDVNLPRPRDIGSLRRDPVFIALFERIWLLLRQEVLRARQQAGDRTG
ncbi:MAG: ABC transporter ATP-binding protein [Thermaerobacter sp.]|nr:mannosyltransferase [Bacillota bacterium]